MTFAFQFSKNNFCKLFFNFVNRLSLFEHKQIERESDFFLIYFEKLTHHNISIFIKTVHYQNRESNP